MRRHYGWCKLAILCGLFSLSVHAADPAPLATRFTLTDRNDRPAASQNRPDWNASQAGPNRAVTATPPGQTKPATPTFAERMQSTQEFLQQQQQADDNRPKPTTWQLQNPANPQNNSPTEMTGPIATNNYFGSQFHHWSNISHPTPMAQLPFNQTAVPTINQTNLYTAPNNYYGSQFSNWSNLSSGQPVTNPFGGWNYR